VSVVEGAEWCVVVDTGAEFDEPLNDPGQSKDGTEYQVVGALVGA
jgi:hypothetical protein